MVFDQTLKLRINNLVIEGQALGDVIFKDTNFWNRLALGTGNYVLTADGGTGKPVWTGIPLPTALSIASQATGSILYYNGTAWVVLPIGSADKVLKVTSGLPSWSDLAEFNAQTNVSIGGVVDTLEHFLMESL